MSTVPPLPDSWRDADVDSEEVVSRLLRAGGPRVPVPEERAHRVRGAVLAEVQRLARARRLRRRATVVAVSMAAAATLLVALRWPRDTGVVTPSPVLLGTVTRVEGAAIAPGTNLHVGDAIATGADGRVAVTLHGSTSLRVDRASRVRLTAPSTIELMAGTIYVDRGAGAPPVHVATPRGVVHDVGTQFEVRADASTVRIRVRSGLVELRQADTRVTARPGVELVAGPDGISRGAIDIHGPDWDWAAAVAPTFDIEGRTLADFLGHVAREQGWTLQYAEPTLARDSSGIVLHGSTSGLAAADALTVVLETSGLVHRLEEGRLVVARTAR